MEIKNRYTRQVIFSDESGTIKEALLNAIKEGVDLSEADLSGADLSGADLSGADLPIYCKWYVTIKDNTINIGCENKSIPEWEDWFNNSTEEFSTKRDAEDFKRIKAMFYAYKTYYEIINNY